MRTSELIGCQVLRRRRRPSKPSTTFIPAATRPTAATHASIDALECGGIELGHRPLLRRACMSGLRALPALFRYLARRSRPSPVPGHRGYPPRIDVSASRDQLQPPGGPADDPTAPSSSLCAWLIFAGLLAILAHLLLRHEIPLQDSPAPAPTTSPGARSPHRAARRQLSSDHASCTPFAFGSRAVSCSDGLASGLPSWAGGFPQPSQTGASFLMGVLFLVVSSYA